MKKRNKKNSKQQEKRNLSSIVTATQRKIFTPQKLRTVSMDFETLPFLSPESPFTIETAGAVHHLVENQIQSNFLRDFLKEPFPWVFSHENSQMFKPIEQILHPGLSSTRRVVLDLAFQGYGLSTQIVDRVGALLGIADPHTKFDPVGGAFVAREHLGLALARLQERGAKFDLIVSEIPANGVTPRVGAFAPEPPPLAKTGRKLLLPGTVTKKPDTAATTNNLALSVWRATQALLSTHGEALLTMHIIDFNHLHVMKEPGLEQVWWACIAGTRATVYLHHAYKMGSDAPRRCLPSAEARRAICFLEPVTWTTGQRKVFAETFGFI